MTSEEWKTIKFFDPKEFDSPDAPGSGINMKHDTVWRLDIIRQKLGRPILVTSGIRSFSHNALVGGVDGSAHIKGWAVDVHCRSSRERIEIVRAALPHFNRIGIAATFVHLDNDPSKTPDVIWLY